MSADKYFSIFLRQMETIVYIFVFQLETIVAFVLKNNRERRIVSLKNLAKSSNRFAFRLYSIFGVTSISFIVCAHIVNLESVFILETHNQTNYKCLPKFVQTDNASLV